MLNRAAAIAVSEIEFAIQAKDHSVHAVVRVNTTKPRQEGITLVGPVIAVGVFEHEQVGTVTDENAASFVFSILVATFFDSDPHRHGKDLVGENSDLVGLAVAVGILEES